MDGLDLSLILFELLRLELLRLEFVEVGVCWSCWRWSWRCWNDQGGVRREKNKI